MGGSGGWIGFELETGFEIRNESDFSQWDFSIRSFLFGFSFVQLFAKKLNILTISWANAFLV